MALLEEFPFESGFRLTDGDLLNKVAAEPAYSVDNTVTATGTTQATAYNIRATTTIITGGADQTGIRLPPPKVGRILFVWNFTASGKRIYGNATDTINGLATADIPFSSGMVLVCTGSRAWSATQSTTSTSGDVVLDASDADTATGPGHSVQIQGGSGGTTSGGGGSINLTAGSAIGVAPGNGGNVQIVSGDSKGGVGGDIIVHAGAPTGNVSLETNATNVGANTTKASGRIQLVTGATLNANSGVITFTTGDSTGTGNTGDMSLTTGKATGTGAGSGQITISTGSTADGVASGAITLKTGNPAGAAPAGAINITAGTPGGVVNITSPGGPVNLTGGLTVSGNVTVGGTLQGNAAIASLPAAKTGTAYSVSGTDYSLILNPSGAFTLTLPSVTPAGRLLNLKLVAAFAVNSASANVVPLVGGAAVVGILPATAGKFATLQSDGTNWQIMSAN